jgi:hypothetical protein
MAHRFSVEAFRSRLVDVIESRAASFRAAGRAA